MTDRRRGSTRPAITAAAGVAACLLLAACNGSSSSTAAAAPAPATAPASSATAPPTDQGPSSTPSPATAPSTGSAATTGGNACSLVTEGDATTALGSDPGPGRPVTSHGASQCQYGTFQSSFVLVNLIPSQGVAGYDRMHSNPKLAQAGTIADVSGVGDRAFSVSGHGQTSVWISQGDSLALVMVAIHGAPSDPDHQALALAKVVSSRL